jgi:hypothetical protein
MDTEDIEQEDVKTNGHSEPALRPKIKRKAKSKPAVKAKPKAKAKVKEAKAPKVKTKGKKAKVRNVDQSKLDRFGFRLGSKKSKAASMYAAKKGATLLEVKKALKSNQFNLLTELEEKGFEIKRIMTPGTNGRQITRFQIAI